jgi:hypothetical protein
MSNGPEVKEKAIIYGVRSRWRRDVEAFGRLEVNALTLLLSRCAANGRKAALSIRNTYQTFSFEAEKQKADLIFYDLNKQPISTRSAQETPFIHLSVVLLLTLGPKWRRSRSAK